MIVSNTTLFNESTKYKYRSEVEIPNNENSKDVIKSLSEEDMNEFRESLKEGYVLFKKVLLYFNI